MFKGLTETSQSSTIGQLGKLHFLSVQTTITEIHSMNRKTTTIALAACFLAGMLSCTQKKEIQIVSESPALKEQANVLQDYLGKIYPDYSFPITEKVQDSSGAIVLKLDKSLEGEEYKALPCKKDGEQHVLTLSAGSERGMHYAVFALLEKLGCGFYLSFEELKSRDEKLNISEIEFRDKPLTKERFVFNWDNFLSGSTAWDLDDWKHYIDQSSKMRFNGLMTHYYADAPATAFSHNGVEKKAGFIANTKKGRQYGTQQVNDVRRLVGGDVFDGPIFGNQASRVPDNERVKAAKDFLREIHKYAKKRYMDVWYGFDVDYPAAHPDELVATLPESAKIKITRTVNKYSSQPYPVTYLPIPDSPEGYAYYRSQVKQIFKDYPKIDQLVVWTRGVGSSTYVSLTYEEFPHRWKKEFDALAASDAKYDKKDKEITGYFATAKVYKTIQKCMKELGKEDVKLWAGSWGQHWTKYANWFYPEEISFIALDTHSNFFTNQSVLRGLIDVAKERELIPVIWAHHDDRAFVGAPFAPYVNLQSNNDSLNSTGMGIIHWTTKPLDIFFKNTEHQVWEHTRDYTLESTSAYMASALVEPEDAESFGNYLGKWVNEGPKFGRETRAWFIDRKLKEEDYKRITDGCKNRIELLDGLKGQNNKYIEYQRKLEEFCLAFYENRFRYQQALKSAHEGDYEKAASLMEKCDPVGVIKRYAEACQVNGVTDGERGILLELNVSWKSFLSSLNQTLGREEVLYNFGTVNYPDFVLGVLNTNFFIDLEQKLWRNYGEEETGGMVFNNEDVEISSANRSFAEICAEGVEAKDAITIDLKPIASDISPSRLKCPDFFKPGKYELSLIFNEHKYSAEASRVFELEVSTAKGKIVTGTIDIVKEAGGKNVALVKTFPIALEQADHLKIVLKSKKGNCLINGAVLRPLN